MILVIFLLLLLFGATIYRRYEFFSLSKKPMETENTLLHMNPFDNIDYIVPSFYLK